jgi:ribonuclease P protein component
MYRRGSRSRHGGITVFQTPAVSSRPEVGVVASRSVGNAVNRNRAKRRLRAAIQEAEFRSDTAYVVVASPDVLDARFGDLTEWLRRAVVGSGESTDKDKE